MKPSIRPKHKTRLAVLNPASLFLSPAFFLLFAFLLFLFTSVRPGFVEGARTRAVDMVVPLFSSLNQPVEQTFSFVESVLGYSDIRAENDRLRAENARLREWYQTALTLRSENSSLKKLLSLKEAPKRNYITARVMADSKNSYAKTLLVAAGQPDGTSKDQAVIAQDGMIGRIIESGEKVSRVLLLTDRNARLPVLIEGTDQRAVLSGTNDDKLVLKYLPDKAQIETGSRIVTSGHGGLFPPGIPVGRIVAASGKEPEVSLLTDLSRVTHVRIVKQDSGSPNAKE